MATLNLNLSIAIINESTPDHASNELYIEDSGSPGNTLSLTLINDSTASMVLHKDSTANASKQNYSFQLYFQPGTIQVKDLSAKVQSSSDGGKTWKEDDVKYWSIIPKKNSDGSVSIWFLSKKKTNTVLNLEKSLRVILDKVKPAATYAYVGNMEWHIKSKEGEEQFCQTYLNILSHQGQEHIPIKVNIERGQFLLNDGSDNTLKFYLINNSKEELIFKKDSMIKVTFYTGENSFALTKDDEAPPSILISNQFISKNIEGLNAAYSKTLTSARTIAGKGIVCSIEIPELKTTLPPGFANIEIHYTGIKGYWDGKIVMPLQRGPLTQTNSNTVDIYGGNSLTAPLSINPGVTSPKITFWGDENSGKHYGFGVSGGQLNYDVDTVNASHVFYANSKNGSGTELLRIQGDGNVSIKKGSLTLTKGLLTLNKIDDTTSPLRISPSGGSTGSKITLLDNNDATAHHGFGVSSGQLNYDVYSDNDAHVFYSNGKNGTGIELLRIQGDKNIIVPGQLTIKCENLDKGNDGQPGAGKVLTSDANGKASWRGIGEDVARTSDTVYIYPNKAIPSASNPGDKYMSIPNIGGNKIRPGDILVIIASAKVQYTSGHANGGYIACQLVTAKDALSDWEKKHFSEHRIDTVGGAAGTNRPVHTLSTSEIYIVQPSEEINYVALYLYGIDDANTKTENWKIIEGSIQVKRIGS